MQEIYLKCFTCLPIFPMTIELLVGGLDKKIVIDEHNRLIVFHGALKFYVKNANHFSGKTNFTIPK